MEKRNANNKKMIFRLILIISVFCTLSYQGCNESDESVEVRKPMIIRKKINPVASINEKQVLLAKNDNIKNDLKNSQKQITQVNNTKENPLSIKQTLKEGGDQAVNNNDKNAVNNDSNTQKIDKIESLQIALADNKEIENETRQNEIDENKSNNETENNSKQNESDQQKQLEKNDQTQLDSLDHKKINLASLSLDKFNNEKLTQNKNDNDQNEDKVDNIKKIDDKILLDNKKNLKQENQKKDISNNINNTITAETDKEDSKNDNDLSSLSKSLQIKYYYNPKGKIDPFKPLISKKKKDTSPDPIKEQKQKQLTRKRYLTQLEKFDISQLKLTAVIMTKKGGKGIVEEASGRGYVVKTGTYIGLNNGKVSDVFLDRIIIKEPEQGFAGSVKYNTKVMKLHKPDGEF